MLRAMREGAKSPVMKVFLVFLAGGFALWGVGDVTTGLIGGSDKAVSASDESVSPIEMATLFDRTRRNYLPNATVGEALQAGLLTELAGSLSRDVVFRAESNDLGLTVTREMQRQAVAREPAFQDQQGMFSEGRFMQTLSNAGLSEESYLREVDTALRRDQLVAALAAGVNQPTAMAETMSSYELEKRSAKLISVDVDIDAIAAPSADVLAAHYDSVKSNYDAPTIRSARVGSLTPALIMADVVVSEDDVKSAFDIRLDEFTTPETRAIRQMVFDDAATAQTALDRINAGEAFNDVAADMLNWTVSDVSLGTLRQSALDETLGNAAFAADAGSAFGPVQSIFGHHLLLIDEIIAGSSATFEDVRPDIEATLKSEAAIDLIYDRVGTLEDKIASGATLDEAMRAVGGTITTIADIDRNGRNIDGDIIDGAGGELAEDGIVRELIWTGDIGELSVIQEGDDDNFFLVEVTGETQSRGRNLAEVNDRVSLDWRRGEAIKAARAAAEAIIADAGKFDTIEASNAFRRNGIGLDHEAARLIATAVFDKDINETDIVETGIEAIAVMTASVTPAEALEKDRATDIVAGVINNAIRQDITNILALELSQKHDLTLNLGPVQQLLIGTNQ